MATVEKYLDSEQRSQLAGIIAESVHEFLDGSPAIQTHTALAKHIADEVDEWIGDLVTNAIDLKHRTVG